MLPTKKKKKKFYVYELDTGQLQMTADSKLHRTNRFECVCGLKASFTSSLVELHGFHYWYNVKYQLTDLMLG